MYISRENEKEIFESFENMFILSFAEQIILSFNSNLVNNDHLTNKLIQQTR